jgi:hypothetical protein
LIRVITNIQDCEALQNDIIKISEWSVENGIEINPEKTKHLRVSLKNCDSLIKYNINGIVINEFNEVNHLGIIMDNKLQFNSNCNQIVKKAYKKWATIKYVCRRADGETFLNYTNLIFYLLLNTEILSMLRI